MLVRSQPRNGLEGMPGSPGGCCQPGAGSGRMSRVELEGSCHCRAVAYRVLLDAQPTSNRCNCSVCTKARTWFVPVAVADFTLEIGRASCREECVSTCRSRWSPYH